MPEITLNKLKKIVDKAVKDGHGRRYVCVDKSTFQHNCEGDGQVILGVIDAGIENILMGDEDGGTKMDSKGIEVTRNTFVLVGNVAQPERFKPQQRKQ